ncbi:MAG TPA: tripartite tricarboxylate transporter substrate-binding protein [Beijerinckiaceae bacterium]|nr:tripartite tricarboxylate transporter substrate-binding protein [Beijerinckiaceae bacterium]
MIRPKAVFRMAISMVAFAVCGTLASRAAEAPPYYAGKTITFSTHTGPGGEYDTYLRLMSQFMGKYIPGNPNIVVLNQPGAGGLLAVNYAAKRAPQDGTFGTLVANGLLLFQALGQPGLEVSLGDFKWIGNFSAANGITVAMDTSGVKTIEEAKQKPVIIGSTGAGSISGLLPEVYNALVGTKFKVVYGYEGTSQMVLAMRRGEIQGRSGAPWHDYLAEFPDEVKAGKLVALSQIGTARDPRLPNAPLLTELVKGDPQKEAAAVFVSLALAQTRSLAFPPGVPDAQVNILRKAFDQVIRDPEFVALAEKDGIDLDPVSGAEVQAAVEQVMTTPKASVALVQSLLNLSGNK